MALSADEQRELAEIERRLATDDPGLATCLTAFRRPGPSRVLSSPRARIIGSLFTVLLVAMVSLMVYTMIPFQANHDRLSRPSTSGDVATSPSGTSGRRPQLPARVGEHGSSATGAASSAPALGRGEHQHRSGRPTRSQAAGQAASSAAGP